MRLIIISGLSGSGKSVALNVLEDLDFYCIDNVPAATLDTLITQVVATKDSIYDNLAVGVDARNRASDLGALPDLIHDLRGRGIKVEVIFLHAGDDILLKRYSETRRKHPLSDNDLSLLEAIARERELLGPIIDCAELIIDTTRTNVYELRASIRERIGARTEPVLSILIESFGYKHGIPSDADFVFDLRCLPNPYWETHLRPFTGKDPAIIDYLDKQQGVHEMYEDILHFLHKWIPKYTDFNRNYLTIALGCTGGQHRSVYMTEKLAAKLGEQYKQVLTRHNELPSSPDNLRQ
ncbi:MAG: RNase adapter RapZ [Gammaproteobacteria bacterium]|nr:RNase adapter RapZ [Gammaproteobacteria bacterium]